MKYLVLLLVIAGLGGGGYFYWKSQHKTAAQNVAGAAPMEITVPTATVETRDISFAVIAAGDIGPADQVSVRMEVNGRINELPVDIGDTLKKGDLLCRLNDRDLQIERDQRLTEISGAKLQIESSQVRLVKAKRDLERAQKLFDENLIAKEQYENFKTDHDAALNNLEIARNSLERAEKALNLVDDSITKTKMAAPFDCTVLTRPVSLGQTVSGAAGFNSGTEVMTIANLSDMIVSAHINQADVIRVNLKQKVDIQVESLPGLKLQGLVERIAPQATIRNGIKGFTTRVQLKALDARVRPGMTATLTIPVASADNVLAVPLAAVFSEEGERYVYVKKDTGIERRDVVVGITDYQFAEVQKGLTEGESVLLEMPKQGLPAPPEKHKEGEKAGKTAKTVSNAPAGSTPPKKSGS
jgi:RND family efflux transporter MFP subunit